MADALSKILVLCIGNPAREDDGIGPAVAARLEESALDGVDVEADYQLVVEDAAAVAEHDAVIFVDAAVEGREPFSVLPVAAHRDDGFSTHSVSPEHVMELAAELFGSRAPGVLLAVRGYSFRMFREEMTGRAAANAEATAQYLLETLLSGRFPQATA